MTFLLNKTNKQTNNVFFFFVFSLARYVLGCQDHIGFSALETAMFPKWAMYLDHLGIPAFFFFFFYSYLKKLWITKKRNHFPTIADPCGSPGICISDMILLLCLFWAGYFQKLDNRKQSSEVSPKSSKTGTWLFNDFEKRISRYQSCWQFFLPESFNSP